jgi:apolipoprotein N-acyltransferase
MPMAGGFAHGLLIFLSLPPVSLWPVTFAAVAVLIWAGCHTGPAAGVSPRRVSLLFGLGTLPWWLAQQVWLLNVTPVGFPLLAIYLAAWSGLTVYLIALLRTCGRPMPMVISAPLAWLACEVLRGEFVLSGYAWFLAGHPLIDAAPLAAPAAMFGAYFVSFLVAALAGSLADAAGWSGVHRRWGGAGAAVVVFVWSLSSVMGRSGGDAPGKLVRELRVGVVQTNVPQGQKLSWTAETIASDFRRFMELTRKLLDSQPTPQVIVWPETMFPGVSLNDRTVEAFEAVFRVNKPSLGERDRSLNLMMVQTLRRIQGESKVPMLIGSDELEGARMERLPSGEADLFHDAKYNSVVLLHDGVVSQSRYDKIELTPFGEFIPLAWRWSAVQDWVLELGAGGMKFDLAVGRRAEPIVIPGTGTNQSNPIAAATPICFEVTRSSLCRRLVYAVGGTRRADLLMNLSNDGWFGDIFIPPVPSDAGRAQHLLASRWRCVELGVPMVRAVNTGISAAIGADGRMLPVEKVEGLTAATRTDGAMIATVPITTRVTIFGRVGNVFAYTFMVLGWLVCGWAWFVGRRTRAISRRMP